jgi:iron complex transport system substrate-binding protein
LKRACSGTSLARLAAAAGLGLIASLMSMLPGAVAAPAGVTSTAATPAAAPAKPSRPRLVSLAPHLTELVYAIGAGRTLVGTVEYSDFPDAARALPRVGDAWRVDMERLVALHPDVVLTWASGTPPDIVERLDALHLRHVDIATFRLADLPVALLRLGDLTGTPEKARTVAETFSAGIASLRREYQNATPVTVFIQLDDQPLFTVNSHHIISEIVELCGGRNVFAALPQLAPPIAIEAVIAADPQVILSTDDTIVDPAAQWRSWRRLTAVRYHTIYSIHADTVARSTPRLVQGTRETCENLADARGKLPPVAAPAR